MSSELCDKHVEMVTQLVTVSADVKYIKDGIRRIEERVGDHVYEGEKEGGFRDRVKALEDLMIGVRKNDIKRMWTAAVIGGLCARLDPEMLWKIIESALRLLVKVP